MTKIDANKLPKRSLIEQSSFKPNENLKAVAHILRTDLKLHQTDLAHAFRSFADDDLVQRFCKKQR